MKSKLFWTLAVIVMMLIGLGWTVMPVQVSESPQATSSGASGNDEFVRVAETAMDELKSGIEELKAASSDVSPDIQTTFDEQIDVLQEQQQAASQTLNELKLASGEVQPYLQVHFLGIWNEIVTSIEAANLLLMLDTTGTTGTCGVSV